MYDAKTTRYYAFVSPLSHSDDRRLVFPSFMAPIPARWDSTSVRFLVLVRSTPRLRPHCMSE